MRSGELRQRLTIEKQQTWLTSWGHETAWRSVACVWASVIQKTGGEKPDNATSGINASVTYTVRMRYRPDVTSESRFKHNDRVLDVVSVVDPDGRRRELVATCVQHSTETTV